jgi:hypothetical protein
MRRWSSSARGARPLEADDQVAETLLPVTDKRDLGVEPVGQLRLDSRQITMSVEQDHLSGIYFGGNAQEVPDSI